MTRLAVENNAINLGQGFPSENGPDSVLAAACAQIASGNNQYAPARGDATLRAAIAADRAERLGHHLNPATDIIITVGATEAIAATILALIEEGDTVAAFEPFYDSYHAMTALVGAHFAPIPLTFDSTRWALDETALRAALTPTTRLLILNTPHNPTGAVFTRHELETIAHIACEHDLIVLADEVYEMLVYDGAAHTPIATLPGMAERTITLSSAAKRFNVTGWKTGWAMGPAHLINSVWKAKQFLTFAGATPLQPAIAHGLSHERAWETAWAADLQARRDFLTTALTDAGFTPYPTAGGYFILADAGAHTQNAAEFCTGPLVKAGVVGIPVSAFVHPTSPAADRFAPLIRFAICRPWDNLRQAASRLVSARF